MFLFKDANFDLQKDGGLGTVLVSNEAQIISCFVFFWTDASDIDTSLRMGGRRRSVCVRSLLLRQQVFIGGPKNEVDSAHGVY